MSNYLSHLDPNWLFIKGDKTERHQPPQMGHLYLFELPLLLIGVYMLLFGRFNKQTKLFVYGWLLLAPLPAAITIEVPHAIRTLNFLPVFQIFIAIGAVTIIQFISIQYSKRTSYLIVSITIFFILWNIAFF